MNIQYIYSYYNLSISWWSINPINFHLSQLLRSASKWSITGSIGRGRFKLENNLLNLSRNPRLTSFPHFAWWKMWVLVGNKLRVWLIHELVAARLALGLWQPWKVQLNDNYKLKGTFLWMRSAMPVNKFSIVCMSSMGIRSRTIRLFSIIWKCEIFV